MTVDHVRDLLRRFQDGYGKRDLSGVDDFMQLFVEDPSLEVIGTGATLPGEGEWCLDREAVRDLIASDWEWWGDFRIDVENARIHTLDRVGWLSADGTVTMEIPEDKNEQNFVAYMREILERESLTPKEKVLELLRGGTSTLYEYHKGETFVWPIRFTAVAVQSSDGWRFHQMQFSFPTTRFPDARLVEGVLYN